MVLCQVSMIYETEKVIKILEDHGIKDPRSAWVTTCCVDKKDFAEKILNACGGSDIKTHILILILDIFI